MFPSTLSVFNRPTSSDRLNSPSHSALHNTVSSALGQVEAVIGVLGDNSVLGTLNTTVFSPSSDGGGHVQSAVKGGTGQTTYTKGDTLVASNSSTLTRLAVGGNGQALVSDSSQNVGVRWVTTSQILTPTTTSIVSSTSSVVATYFSGTIPSNTINGGGYKFTTQLPKFETDGGSLSLKVNYGDGMAASLLTTISGYTGNTSGVIDGMVVGTQVSSQLGFVRISTAANKGITTTSSVIYGYGYGNSSVNSSTDQTITVTGSIIGSATRTSVLIGFTAIEKL